MPGPVLTADDVAQACAQINLAGGVTVDFAAQRLEFPESSPMNVGGFFSAPIVAETGTDFGRLAFKVNPDGSGAVAILSVDQTGAITIGGMPAGWTIAGPGATAAGPTLTSSLVFEEIAGAHTWATVGTITAWSLVIPAGSVATVDGVSVTGPFTMSESTPASASSAATVPITATTGTVYITTQTVA